MTNLEQCFAQLHLQGDMVVNREFVSTTKNVSKQCRFSLVHYTFYNIIPADNIPALNFLIDWSTEQCYACLPV